MIMRKKRQVYLALFLCLPLVAQALCVAQGDIYPATVKRVVDGDTVYFSDGRKVRLVGINTPELDHKNGNHEPFAVAATERLTALAGKQVYWQAARDDQDHYGRKLYYLFTKDRISIASQLLSDGLGYRIAIPPNLKYQECFAEAEQRARQQHLRLWQSPSYWQPQAGFTIARQTIKSITQNKGGWWLETDQDLVINLPPYVRSYWSDKDVFMLADKVVEARGWQYQRKRNDGRFKSWVLLVKHPQDLKVIK